MFKKSLNKKLNILKKKALRIATWCFATLPRKIISSLVIAGLVLSSFWFLFFRPQPAEAGWYDYDWLYRKKITIQADQVDADLTDFPLYVRISSDSNMSSARSDGYDIRFTDANGTLLKYERESWSGGGGSAVTADFWVKVLAIDDTYGAVIYIYYGNASAPDGQSPENTFSDPVATYLMKEGSGSTTYDSTSNNNDGTITNATWTTSGKIGNALSFDGTGDYVTMGDINALDGISALTYMVWVKPNSPGTLDDIVGKWSSSGDNGLTIHTSYNYGADDILWGGWGGTVYLQTTGNILPNNVWTHIVGVFDGTQTGNANRLKLYANGVIASVAFTGTIPATTPNTAYDVRIGADSEGGRGFPGSIDNAMIFNRALTAGEIKFQYYNQDSTASGGDYELTWESEEKGQGPVLWLKFDEGYGTTAYDFSDQGNDFTLSAESYTMSGKFNRAWDGDGAKWLSRADDADFDFAASDDFSISGWFKSDSATNPGSNEYLVNKGPPSAAGYAVYVDTSGDVVFGIDDDTTWNPDDDVGNIGTDYYDNTWHHFTAVKTGTTRIDMYVDGVLISSDTSIAATGTLANSALLYLGDSDGTDNGDEFNGDIDEVKIYRYARSAAQVKRDYNQGFGVRLGGEYTLPSGLVGYWKMDEGSGTTAYDSSGNSNEGTLVGDTAWKGAASCKFGSCLSFDGAGDYVDAGDIDITGDITVSVWVNSKTNVAYQSPVSKYAFDAGWYIQEDGVFPGHWRFYVAGRGTALDPASIVRNQWVHLVGINNGTNILLYKNGVLVNSGASSGPTQSIWQNLFIGRSTNYYFNGQIDNVMIYNRALTAAEIADLYAIGAQEKQAKGYWKMDEGYGTTAEDSSGLGNDLTHSAESYTMAGKFGRAWDGDGAKWLSRADDDDFDFAAADDFSISGWFKSDSAANPGSNEFLIEKKASSAGYAVYLDTSGDVVFGIDDDTTWNPDDDVGNIGSDYYDNTWHHFIAVKTGTSRIDMYVDGVLISSDTSIAATGTLANSALLYLGDSDGTDNGDEFNGDIDEVKIFRFALSADEVKVEYNRGKAVQLGGDRSQAETYCPPGFTGTCTPPVGEWKMDEAANNTCAGGANDVCDSSSNANDGAINGNPVWKDAANCKFGFCLSFDGNGDYVESQNNIGISGANNRSVSLWFQPGDVQTSNSGQVLLYWGETSAGKAFAVFYDMTYSGAVGSADEGIYFAGWDSGYDVDGSDNTITRNEWNYVVITYQSNIISIYINGQLDISEGISTLNTTNSTVKIAKAISFFDNYPGEIDNVMIFNRALTQEEIAWLYNRGKPVGHWKFDEGEGSTAKDSSVNNLSGTISGATWSTSGKYNSGLDFDGTDDVVTVTQNAAINMTSKVSYSVCGWINPDTDGEGDAGRWWSKGNSYVRVDTQSGSTVEVSALFDLATTDATLNTTTTIPTGSWSHICTTWKDDDDDELTIYINGVSAGSSTNGSGAPATDSNNLLIGGSTGANFDGKIDEVKIYNYELSSEQVKLDYNQGAALRFGD